MNDIDPLSTCYEMPAEMFEKIVLDNQPLSGRYTIIWQNHSMKITLRMD